MEPDRVVEARPLELGPVALVVGEVRVRCPCSTGRGGVGQERHRQRVSDRVVAEVGHDPQPVAEASGFTVDAGQVDGATVDQVAPREVVERRVVRHRDAGRQRRELGVGLVLVDLERDGHVQDRPARLAGDDLSGGERSTVTESLDLEADRLPDRTGTDEVRVQRVRPTLRVDRGDRRRQRLCDDLPAEQTRAPRVLRGDADVGVGPVRFQLQQVGELDVDDVRCPSRLEVVHPPIIASPPPNTTNGVRPRSCQSGPDARTVTIRR